MRAAAALMVVVLHVRTYLLVPLADTGGGVLNNATYALTSLGNGAVMFFFVLSGFFVGGSVLRQRREGRFRWEQYVVARAVRLWVVLIPALVVTFVADRAGRILFSTSASYNDVSRAVEHGDLLTFLGNAAFLQSWVVTPYGSNGALWSLSYEWAYYLLFPLITMGIMRRDVSWWARAVSAVVFITTAVLAGPTALILFGAWLLGALLAWQRSRVTNLIASIPRSLLQLLRVGVFGATLLAMMLDRVQGGDKDTVALGTILTAIGAAILVGLFISDVHPRHAPVQRLLGFVDRTLAESSYSLYATHMPILLLIATAITPAGDTSRFEPNILGWTLVLGVTIALVFGGWVFARVTEFHYHAIRDNLLRWLRLPLAPRAAAGPPG
jgi:peptidoglycan/LPS O-acetylase OafA/YrhL